MKLYKIKKKTSGRCNRGSISVRHRGGEHKRYLRLIDWKRTKIDMVAKVLAIEYDPNRTSDIALVVYRDGTKNYILATANMKVGDEIISSSNAEIKEGNCMFLKNIPVGVPIHNLEMTPKKGAQVVKSAGSSAYIESIGDKWVSVKMPSGEIRLFKPECKATIGQVSNPNLMNQKLTKAGERRWRGFRPSVRGVAQHPNAHPHGGGEGRSSIGMNPKTKWGKPAFRKTRKKKKASNRLIVKRRK